MMIKFLRIITITGALMGWLCWNGSAQEKIPENKIAFQSGEFLTYTVSYKVGLIHTDIATVTFEVKNSSVNYVPAYRITAIAEVDNFYKWFFDMRDVYDTWLDKETLRPLYFKNSLKEGSYRAVSDYLYDWNKMSVTTEFTNLKYNQPRQKSMPLSARSFDGLAMFYNMRNSIANEVKHTPGETGYIDLVVADTIKRLQYKFIGREVRDISGLGKYNTLKYSCQLTNSADHDAFQDGSEFFVWFSDDKNVIPLYLESPIRVGSVKARLVRYQGLKRQLGGKVR